MTLRLLEPFCHVDSRAGSFKLSKYKIPPVMKVFALPYEGQFCFHSLKSKGKFSRRQTVSSPFCIPATTAEQIHMAILRDTSLRDVPYSKKITQSNNDQGFPRCHKLTVKPYSQRRCDLKRKTLGVCNALSCLDISFNLLKPVSKPSCNVPVRDI